MKISALLKEAPIHPNLSLDKDLIQKAMLKFPGYNSQQALTLYMADTMAQQQRTDAAQNNLISTQQTALKSLDQELQDYEAQAQETDREVARLKQLSGSLTTGGAKQQQKAKISADELEKLQKDLEALKSKPGMDSQKFKKLEAQINELIRNPSAEDQDVQKLQSLIASVQKKQSIGDDQYNALVKQLQHTQDSLDAKEARFVKYIKKSGDKARTSSEELRKYKEIVDGYKDRIDNFDTFMKDKAEEIMNLVDYTKSIVPTNATASEPPQSNTTQTPSPADVDAQNKARTALNRISANSKNRAPQGLDQQYSHSEKERSFTNIADRLANESTITEDIRPAKDYGIPEYNAWLARDLPVLVKIFKNKYYRELENKHPTYGDLQIAYTCEEHAPYLWNIGQTEEPVITKKQMDIYLTAVKVDLFRQAVEQEQIDLFSESLDKTYSRMLDNIIGLPYIKG